jgi:hypothetical protein
MGREFWLGFGVDRNWGVLRHVLRDVLREHFRLVEPDTYSI